MHCTALHSTDYWLNEFYSVFYRFTWILQTYHLMSLEAKQTVLVLVVNKLCKVFGLQHDIISKYKLKNFAMKCNKVRNMQSRLSYN